MFGIDLSPEGLLVFFSQYAYQPWLVYTFIAVFMTASSFGLPVPEEVVLVSAGLVAFLAQNPERFPPPTPDAEGVSVYTLMAVCLCAVFLSDLLVYSIGKFVGTKLMKYPVIKRQMEGATYARIQKWFHKYGSWCCGIFRFTPGLRFPGHLSCGLLGIPLWKFLAIDGTAALISVPTQVWFVATYGEVIINSLQQFKFYLFGGLAILFLLWWIKNRFRKGPVA